MIYKIAVQQDSCLITNVKYRTITRNTNDLSLISKGHLPEVSNVLCRAWILPPVLDGALAAQTCGKWFVSNVLKNKIAVARVTVWRSIIVSLYTEFFPLRAVASSQKFSKKQKNKKKKTTKKKKTNKPNRHEML